MKILVRLPNWLGDIIMSFPFLHGLKTLYPEAEITVIVKPQYKDLMKLLPFDLSIVEYDKKTDGSLPHEIHKFCVNQKLLFNIDLYFCLPPSFSSAWMGHCFRAKERIGYSGEWRAALLTHKEKPPVGLHRYQEYLKLLELQSGKNFLDMPKIMSRALPKFFETIEGQEEKKYVVINVNSEASSRRLPKEKWLELIELFENQKFVFIGMEQDLERVSEVIALLPAKNEYLNLAGKTNILQLAALISHSQGVVTNDSGPSHLASYLGASVVVFFGAGNPDNTAPIYSKGTSLVINQKLSCSPCLKNTCPLKTLECLSSIQMASVMDQIYKFLYLN